MNMRIKPYLHEIENTDIIDTESDRISPELYTISYYGSISNNQYDSQSIVSDKTTDEPIDDNYDCYCCVVS